MKFDPILHEGFKQVQPLEPDLQAARDAIMAADDLMIIFPLWLGTLPAIMKGFLERVLQPDLIEPYQAHKSAKILPGKSVRVMITMGMPAAMYRSFYKGEALHVVMRNVRGWGARWVRPRIFGNVDRVEDKERRGWLEEVEAMGSRCR
jgi:putative NADPH-quinone reductase